MDVAHSSERAAGFAAIAALLGAWVLAPVEVARGDVLAFSGSHRDSADGLEGASSVAIEPAGTRVFATGAEDDALAVFDRDPATGELALIQVLKDGLLDEQSCDVVEGLDGAASVAVSPDGQFVYVASSDANSMAVFRNNSLGLAFHEVVYEGGGVEGLVGPAAVAVSPDDAHVYVASPRENSVAVFERVGEFAATTHVFVAVYRDDVHAVGLEGATSVAVSPDGSWVYAASRLEDAVVAFRRNPLTGELKWIDTEFDGVGGVDGLNTATSVAVSPDSSYVYVTGEIDDAVAVFERDPEYGLLTFIESEFNGVGGVDGMNGATSVAASADASHVYVASRLDDALAVFAREASGGLHFVHHVPDGGAVDGLDGARSVAVSADGASVYTAAGGDDAVAVFDRNAGTGMASFAEVHLDDGSWGLNRRGGRALALSPDGADLYAASGHEAAVVHFEHDFVTTTLRFVEAQTGPDLLRNAGGLTVSPDGLQVYLVGMHQACTYDHLDGAIATYSRDPATGLLAFADVQENGVGGVSGLGTPVDVDVSPDGGFVYTASQSDNIGIFARDPGTGNLTFADSAPGAWLSDLVLSPDGANVYATGFLSHSLLVYTRDPVTGSLAVLEFHTDGVGGVDGLRGADSVAVAQDGAHVYVTGQLEDAVAVFARSPGTGALTFLEAVFDGVGGVDGLDGARRVALSPSGSSVYVTGGSEDALAVFSRHPATGLLTFVEVHRDGVDGVEGLQLPVGLAASPDGSRVYVGSYGVSTFAFLRSNPAVTEFQVVPEPAGWLSLAAGVAFLSILARRRA